jgi:ATP/maltotriose-dependent transcriptional regulator MalT
MQGRTGEALERIEASRELAIATGAGHVLPEVETVLAVVRATLGDLDAARAGLEAVLDHGADAGWSLNWAELELAAIERVAGNGAQAEEHARQGLERAEQVENRHSHAWAKEILGKLAIDRGDWEGARSLLRDSLAMQARLGLHRRVADPIDGLAKVAFGTGDYEQAARLLGAAEQARSDIGIVRWPLEEPELDAVARHLQAALGEEAFTAAWSEGAELSIDEAADLAGA